MPESRMPSLFLRASARAFLPAALLAGGAMAACTPPSTTADAGPAVDAGPNEVTCADGLPHVAFADTDLEDADLPLHAGGTVKLSALWSGCGSITWLNAAGSAYGAQMLASDLATLGATDDEAVFVFTTDGPDAVYNRDVWQFNIDAAIRALPADAQDVARARMLVLGETPRALSGTLGAMATVPGGITAAGIDRLGRVDKGSPLLAIQGGGFVGDASLASAMPAYYSHLARMAHQVATDGADVVTLLDDVAVTENDHIFTADVGQASRFESIDSATLEIKVRCGDTLECGEWDYSALLSLCSDAACSEEQRFATWITPYARRGEKHWLIDVTHLLPLIKDGGEKTFKFYMQWNMNDNHTTFNLRLRDTGGPIPVASVPLAWGGDFDEGYQDRQEVRAHTQAAGEQTDLHVILSGHGQEAGTNCAEWCVHEHAYTVDGTEVARLRPDDRVGAPTGCSDRAGFGVPPGQGGNWAPGRAYWCPGEPVQPVVFPLTDALTPGTAHDVTTRGYIGADGAPTGGYIHQYSFIVTKTAR